MKPIATLRLLGTALVLVANAAVAQSPATTPKAAAKPAAKPAAAAAAPVVAPPAASGEQLLAASLVLYGKYDCEYGQVMVVAKNGQYDGYVDVQAGNRKATLLPVRSTTGAVRMEELNSGALLVVQIPSKSILMDTKAGKRLIDGCQHDEQKREAAAPAADNNLGINAPGQISTSGTPAGPTRKL